VKILDQYRPFSVFLLSFLRFFVIMKSI